MSAQAYRSVVSDIKARLNPIQFRERKQTPQRQAVASAASRPASRPDPFAESDARFNRIMNSSALTLARTDPANRRDTPDAIRRAGRGVVNRFVRDNAKAAQRDRAAVADLLHTFNRRMDEIQGQTRPSGGAAKSTPSDPRQAWAQGTLPARRTSSPTSPASGPKRSPATGIDPRLAWSRSGGSSAADPRLAWSRSGGSSAAVRRPDSGAHDAASPAPKPVSLFRGGASLTAAPRDRGRGSVSLVRQPKGPQPPSDAGRTRRQIALGQPAPETSTPSSVPSAQAPVRKVFPLKPAPLERRQFTESKAAAQGPVKSASSMSDAEWDAILRAAVAEGRARKAKTPPEPFEGTIKGVQRGLFPLKEAGPRVKTTPPQPEPEEPDPRTQKGRGLFPRSAVDPKARSRSPKSSKKAPASAPASAPADKPSKNPNVRETKIKVYGTEKTIRTEHKGTARQLESTHTAAVRAEIERLHRAHWDEFAPDAKVRNKKFTSPTADAYQRARRPHPKVSYYDEVPEHLKKFMGEGVSDPMEEFNYRGAPRKKN